MRRSFPRALAVLLLALFATSSAWARPWASADPRRDQLKAAVKLRDRNEKGQFLPKVLLADIEARAYAKFDARNQAAGHIVHGHAESDFFSAKRELQDEKMAANRAAKLAAKSGAR
jgi:hypothetical protein